VKHAALALLSIALFLSGMLDASPQVPRFGPNEGEVREIDKAAGEITIRHGPLPELSMDPMTMVFKVAAPALLDRVKVGDRVRFKTDLVDGEFGVTAIDLVTAPVRQALAQAPVTLTHVHGLAYSPDGKRLMVPSHHGLAVFENGKWSKAPGPQHDYMGFAATARNVYSSGHPASGSGLVNPLGLIRSRDGGKSWEKLGLEGETDFHLLAASWRSNAIYVWNPAPSSRIRAPGLHYSLDEGASWRPARASGLEGEPHAIAVHPDAPKRVAVATSAGVFESADSGESFLPIGSMGEGSAVFYDLDGEHLWFGILDGKAPRLARAMPRSGPVTWIKLPSLTGDAVAFIAQNPASRKEYALATFQRSVFVSKDAGRTWSAIANRGKGL
jgi:Cu/Ag efflux protein CusF